MARKNIPSVKMLLCCLRFSFIRMFVFIFFQVSRIEFFHKQIAHVEGCFVRSLKWKGLCFCLIICVCVFFLRSVKPLQFFFLWKVCRLCEIFWKHCEMTSKITQVQLSASLVLLKIPFNCPKSLFRAVPKVPIQTKRIWIQFPSHLSKT